MDTAQMNKTTRICSACGREIPGDVRYCPVCGNEVQREAGPAGYGKPVQVTQWYTCPKCGRSHETYGDSVNPGSFGTCPYCGFRGEGTAPGREGIAADMPKKGAYLTFLIFGFIFGVLWGFLALNWYRRMNEAIAGGDSAEAWNCARKVRMFFLIGLGVNVLVFALRLAAGI